MAYSSHMPSCANPLSQFPHHHSQVIRLQRSASPGELFSFCLLQERTTTSMLQRMNNHHTSTAAPCNVSVRRAKSLPARPTPAIKLQVEKLSRAASASPETLRQAVSSMTEEQLFPSWKERELWDLEDQDYWQEHVCDSDGNVYSRDPSLEGYNWDDIEGPQSPLESPPRSAQWFYDHPEQGCPLQ